MSTTPTPRPLPIVDETALAPHPPRAFPEFSDFEIEAFLVGDLDGERAGMLRDAAMTNAALSDHLDARRRDKEAFAFTHRAPVALRVPPRFTWRTVWSRAFPALGAACAVAALVVLAQPPPTGGGIGVRGAALSAQLVFQRGDRVLEHSAGVRLRQGDRLRVRFYAPQSGFVHVVGAEADGALSVYTENAGVEQGDALTPDALELDDARGPEDLWVFLTPQRMSRDALMEAARDGAPDGMHVAYFQYDKEPAP